MTHKIVFQGKCIFASGSPFPPVEFEGKVYKPGQGNNAYVFPGIALGVICTGMHHISEDAFLISSQVKILNNNSQILVSFYKPICVNSTPYPPPPLLLN